MTTNVFRSLTFVAAVAAVSVGCRDRAIPDSPQAGRPRSGDDVEKLLGSIAGPDKEQVALLALKASLDEAVVKDILVDYLKRHDATYAVLSGAMDSAKLSALVADPEANERIADTIHELATRHKISTNQVASVVVEYRVWRACGDRLN